MALNNELKGTTEGPFIQFEECTYDKLCKFRDVNGKCIFETCIVQNTMPPTTLLWYFNCIICKNVDSIRPDRMKIHACKSCIDRMNDAEVLPFECRFCGATVNSPSPWMFSKLCPSCIGRIHAAAFCGHCGR